MKKKWYLILINGEKKIPLFLDKLSQEVNNENIHITLSAGFGVFAWVAYYHTKEINPE
mgnify:CR=1 FL=1